jgi:hypothetical protein
LEPQAVFIQTQAKLTRVRKSGQSRERKNPPYPPLKKGGLINRPPQVPLFIILREPQATGESLTTRCFAALSMTKKP